ncbi:MarR family winged helix-turn-helix transcriptional regulator [Rugosimonospora africana]|uniref:MarR family transcriptional regulator n=1 Tax=Rugosimonospora africana TaxID=556532 RepID=A0A8J3QXY0_9ACTN|nr:MarR family transcriptional regulator [Rugosimonospora africana]GIH17873.1 MarR family transcriptional regulator [Rugosimonospora africana]
MGTDLRLSRQLCFALYAASRATINVYRPILDSLGLTYPQYLVLLVLWERGDTTVKALGDELMLDSGTLSPLLKRMESAGLVRRVRRPEDERSVLVSLTEAGTALRERVGSVPTTLATATGLGEAEAGQLRDRLVALTEAIQSPQATGLARRV